MLLVPACHTARAGGPALRQCPRCKLASRISPFPLTFLKPIIRSYPPFPSPPLFTSPPNADITQGVPKRYGSMGAFIARTLKEAGPGGFFRGTSTALVMIAPQMGISFAVYEGVKRWKPAVVSAAKNRSDTDCSSSNSRGESDGRGEWSTTECSRENPREPARGDVVGVSAAAAAADATAAVESVVGVGAGAVSSTREGAEHEERVPRRMSSGRTGAEADDLQSERQRRAGVRSWLMGMKTIMGRGLGKEYERGEGAVVPPAIVSGTQQQRLASTVRTAEEGPCDGPATAGTDGGGSRGGRQNNGDLDRLLVSWIEVGWPVVAGAAAGITSKLVVLPLDTVKKRVQTEVRDCRGYCVCCVCFVFLCCFIVRDE